MTEDVAAPAKRGRKPTLEADVDHGTPAGYYWHKRTKTPMCDACRPYGAEAKKKQRDNRGTTRTADDRKRDVIYGRALRMLAKNHPEELAEIRRELEEKMAS